MNKLSNWLRLGLGALLLLVLPLMALPAKSVMARDPDPPQTYNDATNTFQFPFGFIIKDYSTILMRSQSPQEVVPGTKDAQLTFTKVSETKNSGNFTNLTYVANFQICNPNCTNTKPTAFRIVIVKEALTQAIANHNTPVRITEASFTSTDQTPTNGDRTNGNTFWYTGSRDCNPNNRLVVETALNCGWPVAYVFFDAQDTDLTSVQNGVNGTNPSGGGGGGPQTVTCESGNNPLNWILCPVFNGVADASDWLFHNFIQPFLYTSPIPTDNNNGSFQVWSSFRVYGNIFLIIAMLVVIFGTAIGGGLIDAYTAKKVLPRILIAAILINLSVYIVNFLVDVTNIIGGGLGELMLAPLKAHHQLSFTPSVGTSIPIVFWTGFLGLMLGTGTISGILIGLFTGGGIFLAKAGVFILMVVIIPVVLALLGVFVTLILRRGLILFLILISPVAFALYALPNTEQFFRRWWKTLFETLMVYPIIIAIFAVADILSVTIITSNGVPADSSLATQVSATSGLGAGKTLALVVAFVLQFLPLALIPFAFRFAGGAVAALHGVLTNGRGKVHGMLQGRRERAQQELRSRTLGNRERAYQALGAAAGRRRGVSRWGLRQLQNRVGGYDLYAARAADRADRLKEAEATIATGIDDERRGLTVNKRWALEQDSAIIAATAPGADFTGAHVMRRNGRLQFRTLGGRWVSESDVDQAHARWDGSDSDLQASIAYEMQKATTQEEMDYLYNNFARMNQRGSGFNMSQDQFGGVWIGAAFQKQNTDRQWKQYAWNGNSGRLEMTGVNLMREIDERQGSWQMASQSADTWTTMSEEVGRARNVIATGVADGAMTVDAAQEVLQRGVRIARSLQGGYQDPETGRVFSSIGQGANPRTKEEMENFSALFNVEQDYVREYGTERRGTGRVSGDTPRPPGPVPPGTGGTAPPNPPITPPVRPQRP